MMAEITTRRRSRYIFFAPRGSAGKEKARSLSLTEVAVLKTEMDEETKARKARNRYSLRARATAAPRSFHPDWSCR